MKLGRKELNAGSGPYFIAEMSGNHNHSLERAFEIIDAAAEAGADALKIQTYTPDTMTLDLDHDEFFIEDKKSLWKGNSLYNLYKMAMTPWEWHAKIKERCELRGLDFFSTPFDASSVDFLETLNVPFYKIASFELNDIPLIKKAAQTKKPMIMSTGMATISEIAEAVEVARNFGSGEIVLLKCTSAYPALPKDANLSTMKTIKETFGTEIGLSDHTMGTSVAICAAVLGASVIEKHFTIRRSDGGVDSAFSMEPSEFKEMVQNAKIAIEAIGTTHFGLTDGDRKSRVFRRSIYFSEDVIEGETLSLKNVRVIRPGLGLEPKFYENILGRKAKSNFKKGTPVYWDKII